MNLFISFIKDFSSKSATLFSPKKIYLYWLVREFSKESLVQNVWFCITDRNCTIGKNCIQINNYKKTLVCIKKYAIYIVYYFDFFVNWNTIARTKQDFALFCFFFPKSNKIETFLTYDLTTCFCLHKLRFCTLLCFCKIGGFAKAKKRSSLQNSVCIKDSI